jgi:uncharacterized protein (DUF362 family)
MSKVSVIKCPNYVQADVDKAVAKSLKDLGIAFNKDDKVMLKPNMLMAKKPEFAVSTHPSVVEAVCKILKNSGCEIMIAESSGWNTENAFTVSGIRAVAEKYDARIIILEKQKTVEKNIGGKVLKSLKTTDIMDFPDYIINLPKMKTHSLMKITGAVKNIFGLVPGTTKPFYHMKGNTEELFAELLLDIYEYYKPKIKVNIMDAIIGMEGEGPGNGDPKNTGLIIASTDALSLDIVQARIMGVDLKNAPYINAALKRGASGSVELSGDIKDIGKYPEYRMPGKRNLMKTIVSSARTYLFKPEALIPDVDKRKCIKCSICAKNCPVNCISMKPYPTFDRSICIKCYCCHEHCPEGAIYLTRENAQ